MKKWFLAALTAAAVFCALLGSASAYTGVPDYFAAEIQTADSQGLIPELLENADLSGYVTRREFCHVIVAAYDSKYSSGSGSSSQYDPWSGWIWYYSAPAPILQTSYGQPDLDSFVESYFDEDGVLWFVDLDGDEWTYDGYEWYTRDDYDDDWWNDADGDDDWWDDEDDERDEPSTDRPSSYFSDVNDSVIDRAYELGFVSGYEDGTFRPDNQITRQEMFKMMNALLEKTRWVYGMSEFRATAFLNNYPDGAVVADWAKPAAAQLLYYGIVNGSNGMVDPASQSTRAQAIVLANRVLNNELTPSTLSFQYPIISDMNFYFNSSGLVSSDEYGSYGNRSLQEDYVFDGGARYATQAETTPHIVSVKVPVWRLNSNGTKTASTATVQVHEKIQHIIWAVFNEIYNDPEQFPIADLGGYSWRGDTSNSEHKWGLAVDINSNANPQIWNGVVRVGTAWNPGVDPYSITPEGSVVRIFKKYGFTWGGDAWGPENLDYMHFSYLGT